MVHELPFAFIEYELFTLLMKSANPHYVKISRATAKADCWTSYEVEKKMLNGMLKTMDKISITTDMWNLSQIEDVIDNDVFSRYAQRDTSYKHLPSDEDWLRVEEVCSFLALFNEVTNIILGSEYPTSNLFLPELWSIKELLMQKTSNEELWMQKMVDKMQRKFDKYWGECNLLISVAAILDPRNKMKLIDFSFRVMYSEDEAPRQIRMVRDILYELYKEYVDEYATANVNTTMESDVQESGVINTCTTSRIRKGKVLNGMSKFERYIRSVDTIDNVKSEIDIYLREGVFICKEECESAFSAGGRVIDTYRSSLGTDTVQMLLCGSDWYQNFYGLKKKAKSEMVSIQFQALIRTVARLILALIQVAKMAMTRSVHPLVSLNPYQGNWTIKVRLTSKGNMRSYKNARGEGCVFNVELTDEDGTQIQATMFNQILQILLKFQIDILEHIIVFF
ncbi:hypothetical protein V6N11_049281 [Hibiscus sabdariffa]|uniref:Uncharacterized protein n=1 Tax=Hibiscus sabdariffa TaxID=183260 RepID=A0ABR2P054_9ROSI